MGHFPHSCLNIGVETIQIFQRPEKGGSKWRSICSNLHRVNTPPPPRGVMYGLGIGGFRISDRVKYTLHIQVLFVVGLLDMKMIKLDCIKSHQRVSLYYCLRYIQYASELMTGIWKMRLRFYFAYHVVYMSLNRVRRCRKFSIDSCYKTSCQILPVLILINVGLVILM